MLKNFNKEGQKLPLFGVGPYMVWGMAVLAITGITLMWHNAWMLILPLINWLIMTVTLINTEEKWLSNLYGKEYAEYKSRVNRCIPWRSKE